MKIRLFQVDAFTNRVFGGNPAAVCILDTWLDTALMQQIAAENNLSETAFAVEKEEDMLTLDFPADPPEKIDCPKDLIDGIGNTPVESYRKGELQCELLDGRIYITGRAVTYLEGEIEV